MKSIPILFALVLLCTVGAKSQGVYWSMQPRSYQSIERIAPGLYKAVQQDKVGVIDAKGGIVVPLEHTQIEPFYEGRALLVVKEGDKEQVTGVLTSDGTYKAFPKAYYLLAGQKFYSEGKLTVQDERQRRGYIDDQGSPVLGFDKGYTKIKPFTEGYASVFKGNSYQLINHQGDACHIMLGVNQVNGGTNVYQGKAIVWDTNGDVFEYMPATGGCRKVAKPSLMTLDYLYCLTVVSHRSKQLPYDAVKPSAKGLAPVSEGGKYGYVMGGKTLIAPQFTAATQFEDDIAVVTIGGKCGLLRYDGSQASFSLEASEVAYDYAPGETVTCGFSLTVPQAWRNSGLKVSLTDEETRSSVPVTDHGQNEYSFKCKPMGNSGVYQVGVYSADGMLLWSGEQAYVFKKKVTQQNLSVSISVKNDKANSQDQCVVVATIHNPNDQPVSCTVTMKGSAAFHQHQQAITVPAHGSQSVSSYFIVKKNLPGQSVTVTTSRGGSATKSGLDLIPFYTGG